MNPGLALRAVALVRPAPGGERLVLNGLSADMPAGRLVLITGATGAGKSALLQILALLRRPTAGVVLADSQPVSRWRSDHRDRWRRQAGIVFQQPCLLDDLSVFENVLIPLLPRGGGLAAMRRAAVAALVKLSLEPMARCRAEALSAGERQRLEVARAIVSGPRFLLADEPTAHQDEAGTAMVRAALCDAAAGGATVVVATHDLRLLKAEPQAKRFHLAAGRLSADT